MCWGCQWSLLRWVWRWLVFACLQTKELSFAALCAVWKQLPPVRDTSVMITRQWIYNRIANGIRICWFNVVKTVQPLAELPHKQFPFELLKETLKRVCFIERCKFCGVSCMLPFLHSFHSVHGSLSFEILVSYLRSSLKPLSFSNIHLSIPSSALLEQSPSPSNFCYNSLVSITSIVLLFLCYF